MHAFSCAKRVVLIKISRGHHPAFLPHGSGRTILHCIKIDIRICVCTSRVSTESLVAAIDIAQTITSSISTTSGTSFSIDLIIPNVRMLACILQYRFYLSIGVVVA